MMPAVRHPMDPRAVFVLGLCLVTGVPLLFGASPEDMDRLLPTWAVLVWALSLSVGAGVTLWGMTLRSLNGVVLEQIGSVAVGAATIFWSVVVIMTVGFAGIPSAAIVLGWGAANFLRWGQLQAIIAKAKREGDKLGDAQ